MLNTGYASEGNYIVENIDRAIQEGWIKVVYQPVIRTVTGKVCGLEALARWSDPERGELLPEQFIPVLEKENKIDVLDRYVLKKACADCRCALDEHGIELPFSVNVSGKDFTLMDLYQVVEDTVMEAGLRQEIVRIEIRESAVEENSRVVKETLEKLRMTGYGIFLDDFGYGASSLSVLKDYSFGLLKIDINFLADFSPRSKKIMNAIVIMATELAMDTLAEGVESKEQVEFLRSIGCDKMQGYYFMKAEGYEMLYEKMRSLGLELESESERNYYNELYRMNILRNLPVKEELNAGSLWENFNENSGLGIFWKDKQRRFVGANRKFMEYYGFTNLSDFVGKTDEDMGWHVNPDPYRDDEYSILREGKVTQNVEGHCIAHGSIRNIIATKMPIYDNGRIIGLVGFFRDITEEQKQQYETLRSIETDVVTGLLNIRGFTTARMRYEDEFNRHGTDFTEIHLSIDNFDELLSKHSRAFGDEILYAVGKKLNYVIGRQATLVRYSRNGFIVMKQVQGKEEAGELAKYVCRAISEVVNVNGFSCKLYSSVGYALFSDYQAVEILQMAAEQRLKREQRKNAESRECHGRSEKSR